MTFVIRYAYAGVKGTERVHAAVPPLTICEALQILAEPVVKRLPRGAYVCVLAIVEGGL